jgi:integrase
MRSRRPALPDEVSEVAEVIRRYVAAKRPGDTKAEKVARYYLHSFAERWRGLTVAALTPQHVTVWMDGRPSWGSECRWHAITLLSACLNWSQAVLGTRNPIKGMARPARKSRGVEAVIPADVHKTLVAGASRHVADVLTALKATGARPGEVLSVTAADFNERAGVWVLAKHKTAHKTGRPRVIVLTDELVELCRRLAVRYPTGPLFRSPSGAAWSANAFGCQVRRLRHRLGLQRVFPYCYRHTLLAIPTGGSPEVRLAALNRLRLELGLSWSGEPDPLGRCVRGFQESATAAATVLDVHFRDLVANLVAEIGQLVEAGAVDPDRPLIRSADFGDGLTYRVEPVIGVGPARVWFERINHLPADHPLRALQGVDWYRDGGEPAIVLGWGLGEKPRKWYDREESLPLTAAMRSQQRQKEETDALASQQREAEQQARLRESTTYRLQKVEEENAALKRQLAELQKPAPTA